ncbi:MAG: TMEM165/GDT1 family protein [bacterium]
MNPAAILPLIDWNLLASTFFLIALAELPDKTALATVLMASRLQPSGVFLGVTGAFLVQTLIAVLFGNVFRLLPHEVVQLLAAVMFLGFAAMSWIQSNRPPEEVEDDAPPSSRAFWKTAGSAFLVIFIAEWGDLTQLATAALTAQTHQSLTVFLGAFGGLCASSGFTVWLGSRAKNFIKPKPLQRAAAVVFALVGFYMLWRLKS